MKYFVIAILLTATMIAASAQTTDVPPGHWAYEAVNDLANKGLVIGYPDGKFLGNRSITRYEMATIVKRVVDGLDAKIEEVKAETRKDQTPAPVAVPAATVSGPSQEDFAKIQRLVDEYKVELTVIGADLKKVQSDVENVKSEMEDIKAVLNDPEGKVETLKADVSTLKKIKVSGYVQSRFEQYQGTTEGTEASNKNGFYVRRGRLKLTATPSSKTEAVVYFAADRGAAGVKEAYVDYAPRESKTLGMWFRMGQFLWPFGYEVWDQSSGDRESPERAQVNRSLFTDERDRGFLIGGPQGGNMEWVLGLVNGNGVGATGSTTPADNNDTKDVVGRAKFHLTKTLDLGVSGYSGKAVSAAGPPVVETDKTRWGADLQYYLDNASIKGEYITGKQLGFTAKGWWGQLAYNVSPKDVLVAKYDTFDDGLPTPSPLGSFKGVLSAWNLGWIRYLDDNLRFKVFYELKDEEFNSTDNDGWRVEMITKF